MTYVLDTGIALLYLRNKQQSRQLDSQYQPFDSSNIALLSVVSIGELRSLSHQRRWGAARQRAMNALFSQLIITDINIQTVIDAYAEIDAFSQGKLVGKPLNQSARNMGKNDLWIAATAVAANATLLTLDQDFDHLKDAFLNLERVHL